MLKLRHDKSDAFGMGQDRPAPSQTLDLANYPKAQQHHVLGDLRFRRLLGARQWAALPNMVRKRFSKRLSDGAAALYAGYLAEARFSVFGRCLANIMRIIGAPLPLHDHIGAVATVSVVEDLAQGGQIWSRSYHHANGFPQTIHSVKEFAGPTGIREYIGHGLGMALRVEPIENGLAFRSDHYFLKLAKRYIALPKWLVPMHLEVCHIDKGHDPQGRSQFDFSLRLEAPLLGELVYQRVRFHDR
ncbi:DUF4166 domain-containing protein [Parasphingorhabdus sp. DH2-15]|uniref:DUF4166 domain-containing protein n=1 Tax=Parasphingorhabdus sp. DH2-15 TaxID=3444112 RepID=UPI003F684D13